MKSSPLISGGFGCVLLNKSFANEVSVGYWMWHISWHFKNSSKHREIVYIWSFLRMRKKSSSWHCVSQQNFKYSSSHNISCDKYLFLHWKGEFMHLALIMTRGKASLYFYTTNLLGLHHHSHPLFFNLLSALFCSEWDPKDFQSYLGRNCKPHETSAITSVCFFFQSLVRILAKKANKIRASGWCVWNKNPPKIWKTSHFSLILGISVENIKQPCVTGLK